MERCPAGAEVWLHPDRQVKSDFEVRVGEGGSVKSSRDMIQFRRVYGVAAILMFGMSLAAETLPDNAVELDRQRFGIVPEGRYVYITNGVYRGSLIPAKLGAYAPITNRLNSVRSDYGYRELMGTNEYSCGCGVFCCDYLDSTMPPGAAVVYVDTSGVMNWFSDADGRKAAWTIFGLRKRGVGGPAGPSYHRCGLYEYFPDADRLRFLRSRGKDTLSDFKEIERRYDEELPLTDIEKALRICNSYQGLRLPSRLPWKDGSLVPMQEALVMFQKLAHDINPEAPAVLFAAHPDAEGKYPTVMMGGEPGGWFTDAVWCASPGFGWKLSFRDDGVIVFDWRKED